jgi:hypothetical protein
LPAVSLDSRLRVLHCDATVAVAEKGAVCIVIWRGAVGKESFERQRSGLDEVVRNHPGGAGFVCVIEKTAKPPDEVHRRASAVMVDSHGERLRCLGCVVEGDGFMASVARGAVGAILLVRSHRKTPVRIVATVPLAVSWVAEHMEIPSVSELERAVEQLRSMLPPVIVPPKSTPESRETRPGTSTDSRRRMRLGRSRPMPSATSSK